MVAFWIFNLVGCDAAFAYVEFTLLLFAEVHPLLRRLAARIALELGAFVRKLAVVFASAAENH
jgi:hypothetical protein